MQTPLKVMEVILHIGQLKLVTWV